MSTDGPTTIHECVSTPSVVTIGALNVDSSPTSKYVCMACGRPNQRACECTHEEQNPVAPGRDPSPCANGIVHWCLYLPQFMVKEEADGLYYCRHNDANSEAEKECGKEGHEACLDDDGSYSCTSPVSHDGEDVIITAVQDGTDSTLTVMCEACGKPGLPACKCATLPSGTCPSSKSGNAFYCENGDAMYMSNEKLFCA